MNFITKFTKSIVLDNNHECAVGLNRKINMSFTWFNINAGYDNQLIRFSSDSGTNFTDITFKSGVLSYSDFDTFIKEKTVIKKKRHGAKTEDVEYPVALTFNETPFKVTVTLKTNY